MTYRLMLATGLVLLGSGAALAADQGPADWSGFYAGVFAGYAVDEDPKSSTSGAIDLPDTEGISYEYSSSLSPISTAIGGVRAGYNYQHGALVLGLEGSIGAGNFEKTASSSFFEQFIDDDDDPEEDDSFTVTGDGVRKFTASVVATAEAKIGFAWDNWLIYGKGGLAVANSKTVASVTMEYEGPAIEDSGLVPLNGSGSNEGIAFGTTFSVGAETFVGENLSVGAELGVLSLDTLDSDLDLSTTSLGIDLSSEPFNKATTYTARFGLNYHF